jgi:thiol:disulfide interchange protein
LLNWLFVCLLTSFPSVQISECTGKKVGVEDKTVTAETQTSKMISQMVVSLSVASICVAAVAAGGGNGDADFSEAVSKHFLEGKTSKEQVFPTMAGKPVMVIITQPWCGACKAMKKQINDGAGSSDSTASLMAQFSVVHVVGDATSEVSCHH